MQSGSAIDTHQRIDGGDCVGLGLFGIGSQPRFVKLHHVCSRREQRFHLFVHAGGIVHRQAHAVRVVVVLGLLCHGKGTRDCGFDEAVCMFRRNCVSDLDRTHASNGSHHAARVSTARYFR